jgi:hypothetical protein
MTDKEFDALSAKFLKDNGLQFAPLAEIDAKLEAWKAGSAEDKARAERLEDISNNYLPISGAKFVEDPSMIDLVKIRAEMMVVMRGEPYERLVSYVNRVLRLKDNDAEAALSTACSQVAVKILQGKLPKDLEPEQIKDAVIGLLAAPALRTGTENLLTEILTTGPVTDRAGQKLE